MADGDISCVYVKKQYFIDNKDFVKMLDPTDVDKQGRRSYLFLKLEYNNNNLLIPLRKKVEPIKKFGVIGYSVPSSVRPMGGFDYRYILIVNDYNYLTFPKYWEIPESQQKIISSNFNTIQTQALAYVKGYVSAAIKNREDKEPKYRESSLRNFHDELGVTEGRKNRLKKI